MDTYTSVSPSEIKEEPRFVGGITLGYQPRQPSLTPDLEANNTQNEIPLVFSNKNRRRLFYCLLATFVAITAMIIGLLVYAFTKV